METSFNGLGCAPRQPVAAVSRPHTLAQCRKSHRHQRRRVAWPPKAPAPWPPVSSGRAGRLRRVSPCLGTRQSTLADIAGPGAIQHIWLTVHPRAWRSLIWRCYWDDEPTPSVEVPLGDFFCCGWGVRCQVNSLPVAVNPAGGFNCYWEMPFRQHARITLENLAPEPVEGFYYQIELCADSTCPTTRENRRPVAVRSNPLPYMQVHTVLAGVQGQGHYVGTYHGLGHPQ